MAELTLDDINEGIEADGLSEEEKDSLEGKRAKIISITPKTKDAPWADKDMIVNGRKFDRGDLLPEGTTVPGMVAVVELEPIMTSKGRSYSIKEDFALKKDSMSGKWGPSLHEKSKSKMLFNKLKVNTFKECIGKEVMLVKKVNDNKKSSIKIAL